MKTNLLKKIEDFANRTSMWKMFFILIPFYFVVFYFGFYAIFYFCSENPNIVISQGLLGGFLIALSLFLSVLMSFMTSSAFDASNKSDKFWNSAKEFEKLIFDASSKKDLEKLFENNFEELKKLSQGSFHNTELHRLKSMMDIKYNLIN